MGYSDEFEAEDCLPFREPRLPRMLTVKIHGRFGQISAIARNLSDGGMGGTTKQWLVPGENVYVELPNLGRICGRVIWTDGTRFGICFFDSVDAGRVARNTAAGMDPTFEVMDRFRPVTSMRRPPLRVNAA